MKRKVGNSPAHIQVSESNISHKPTLPLKLKIPARLSSKLAHSYKLRSAIDTFLILKAAFSSGKIELTKDSRIELTKLCSRDFKTLHTRLKRLQSLQVIEYTKQQILLCSWEKLATVFEYEMRGNYYVRYDGSKKVSDILEAKFMAEKEAECKAAFKFKLNRNQYIKDDIENVAGSTSTEAVKHSQLYHYLNEGIELNEDEKFALFEVCRADTSLSYRTWSFYFELHSRGGFAYKKRKLVKLGLIAVEKRRWKLNGTHTTRASRKSLNGTAAYIPKYEAVVFSMPDKLTYLSASVSLPIAKLEQPLKAVTNAA